MKSFMNKNYIIWNKEKKTEKKITYLKYLQCVFFHKNFER